MGENCEDHRHLRGRSCPGPVPRAPVRQGGLPRRAGGTPPGQPRRAGRRLPDAETFRADLLDPAQLTAAVTAIGDRFGHVDVALLYASGTPALGNVGIALAGMRNYVHGAPAALAGAGVHVGIVPLDGLIKNSAAEAAVLSAPAEFANVDLAASAANSVDPDDIAEVFWDLHRRRDRVEEVVS